MSSGRRAQNLLNLKIARSAPVFRDYPKPACVVESKVLFHARNKMFVAIQTHSYARTCALCACLGFRVLFRIDRCGLRGRRASSIVHLGRYIRGRNSAADQARRQHRGVGVWARWRYARIVLGVADQRLCRAKREGRNCVIAVQAVAGIVAREISAEFLWAGMSPRVTFEIICNF
jgi:hypothetical protein